MSEGGQGRQIFVVDDDDAVRDSLDALLSHRGFTVNTFGSSTVFLERIGELAGRACLLLDIRMPGMDGLEVLSRVVARKLPLAIVMITGHADVPTAVRAMKTGAVDFIEKPFTQDTILVAVSKAFDSLDDVQPSSAEVQQIAERIESLSPRERDVLGRLVDGLTNKEIARELDISPRTVEVYRAGVMDKMAARNLSALVKMGLAAGFGKSL
jgi:two-component system, LuxR family, response regulator FixJ